MKIVLQAAPISQPFCDWIDEEGYDRLIIESEKDIPAHTFPHIVGIVTSNKLHLTEHFLQRCSSIKWIARMGSGMEIVDTAYTNQMGIATFSSPTGIANSVAEHTVGMMLALRHRIYQSMTEISHSQWIREPNRGMELENLRVGIIGYGHTGSAFASKLRVFTPTIFAYDKYKKGFGNDYVKESSLSELFLTCDVISFHVPLNDETYHYYNQSFMDSMTTPHMLINTSRGKVCDTSVILKGLQQGKIWGACLDVLEEESDIQDTLLREHNIVEQLLKLNVILTPHIAGYSHEATIKMSEELMNQLKSIH